MQNFLFKEKRQFSRFEAWIYLLMSANHTDTEVLLGNQLIKVKKGSFITSEVKLMAEFQWSKSKLRAFLSLLESQTMIEKITDTKKTTLTIVKYSDYQELQTAKKPRKNRERTAKELRADTDNNENNYNNDNNENNTNPTEVELVVDTRLDFSGFNNVFLIRDLWKEWIEYKTIQYKDQYKTIKSEQTAIDNLQKLCRGDTETARLIIDQSIANLWKGLFEPKQQINTQPNNPQKTQKQNENEHHNAHALKHLRSFEREGDFSPRTIEIARDFCLNTAAHINVYELIPKLEQLEKRLQDADQGHSGDTLRIGF